MKKSKSKSLSKLKKKTVRPKSLRKPAESQAEYGQDSRIQHQVHDATAPVQDHAIKT